MTRRQPERTSADHVDDRFESASFLELERGTERVAYSEEGQLLSGSYQDYALPRAADVPSFGFQSHPAPCTTNPLGAKGCGEAGCAGSLPAVMNAVVDALSARGVAHIDMPATPERVWRALQDAAARAAA